VNQKQVEKGKMEEEKKEDEYYIQNQVLMDIPGL